MAPTRSAAFFVRLLLHERSILPAGFSLLRRFRELEKQSRLNRYRLAVNHVRFEFPLHQSARDALNLLGKSCDRVDVLDFSVGPDDDPQWNAPIARACHLGIYFVYGVGGRNVIAEAERPRGIGCV